MSGVDERRNEPGFTCLKCGIDNSFWYVVGFRFNGWRRYGILRSEGETVNHDGIRLSVFSIGEDERTISLPFYQADYWLWQLKCPACGKVHHGGYKAHKRARVIMRTIEPENFKVQVLSDML